MRSFVRSLIFCLLVLAAVYGSLALVATAFSAEVEYPIQQYSATEESGVIFNRQPKPDGDCPDGTCPRTEPVPGTPPAFDAPPVDAIPPGAPVAPVAESTTSVALTPEQKQALTTLLTHAVSVLLGAFMGTGSLSPFLQLILGKLMGAVGGSVPPATPARTVAKRVAKKK